MATLAGATADAMKHKAQGEHETQHGASLSVPLAEAERIIESWPDAPRKGARQMIEQYGAPNEATPTKLFWYKTIASRTSKRSWNRLRMGMRIPALGVTARRAGLLLANPPARHSRGREMIETDIIPDSAARERFRHAFGLETEDMESVARRAQELFPGLPVITWEGDAETFRFSYVSEQAERVLGYPKHRWVSEATFWADTVVHPDDRTDAIAFCALAAGNARTTTSSIGPGPLKAIPSCCTTWSK